MVVPSERAWGFRYCILLEILYFFKKYAPFAERIFPLIDERLFSVLYSDKTCRPNTPLNVIGGALILNELQNQTDDEILNLSPLMPGISMYSTPKDLMSGLYLCLICSSFRPKQMAFGQPSGSPGVEPASYLSGDQLRQAGVARPHHQTAVFSPG